MHDGNCNYTSHATTRHIRLIYGVQISIGPKGLRVCPFRPRCPTWPRWPCHTENWNTRPVSGSHQFQLLSASHIIYMCVCVSVCVRLGKWVLACSLVRWSGFLWHCQNVWKLDSNADLLLVVVVVAGWHTGPPFDVATLGGVESSNYELWTELGNLWYRLDNWDIQISALEMYAGSESNQIQLKKFHWRFCLDQLEFTR